jgi:hypothetical protein
MVKQSSNFSLSKFPDANSFKLSAMLVAVGVALLVASFLQPQVLRDSLRNAAIRSATRFELLDEISAGRFSGSERAGDTTPSPVSSFLAIYALSQSTSYKMQYEEYARLFLQQVDEKEYSSDTEQIFQRIIKLKGVGLLDETQKTAVRDYYDLLLDLHEKNSGFRLNPRRSASASATAFAFKAFNELGLLEEFKKTEQYTESVNFVTTLKDNSSLGFRDSANEEPSLLSTWFAAQVLDVASEDLNNDQIAETLAGVDTFVYKCQLSDGGFQQVPVQDVDQLYSDQSTLASTAQALYVLEVVKTLTKQSSLLDFYGPSLKATNYLRSCVTLNGVLSGYRGKVDLESTFYFFELINRFPYINYSTPPSFQAILVTLSGIFILAGLLVFYKPQLPPQISQRISSEALRSLLFLVAGAVALKTYEPLAIVVYLVFVFYLTIEFYELQKSDVTGDVGLIALGDSALYMALVWLLLWVSPYIFTQVSVFYVLVVWGAAAAFVTTFGGPQLIGNKSFQLLVNTAFQAWALNVGLLFSYLYGRGDMAVVYRVLNVQGYFPLVFVLVPLVSLGLSYLLTSVAASMVVTEKKKK